MAKYFFGANSNISKFSIKNWKIQILDLKFQAYDVHLHDANTAYLVQQEITHLIMR